MANLELLSSKQRAELARRIAGLCHLRFALNGLI